MISDDENTARRSLQHIRARLTELQRVTRTMTVTELETEQDLQTVLAAYDQVKCVVCEVCWTTSWVPIEKVEDAFGITTKLHGNMLTRCDYCWREKVYADKLAASEQRVKLIRPMIEAVIKRHQTAEHPESGEITRHDCRKWDFPDCREMMVLRDWLDCKPQEST